MTLSIYRKVTEEMSVNIVQGFVTPKIQSLQLEDRDCKKYGIPPDVFQKVDKNNDGLITADEFLTSGLSQLTIVNAFKTIAKESGGFLEGDLRKRAENGEDVQNVLKNKKPQNTSDTKNLQAKNNNFNLNHPMVTNPALAQKYDYMA